MVRTVPEPVPHLPADEEELVPVDNVSTDGSFEAADERELRGEVQVQELNNYEEKRLTSLLNAASELCTLWSTRLDVGA